MSHRMLQSRSLLIGALALIASFAIVSLGQAGKPGGGGDGGTPAGTIYYHWRSKIFNDINTPSEDYGLWTMDADGGGKLPLDNGALYPSDHPSYQLHGGTRWWLTYERSTQYADRLALYAISEAVNPDGSPAAVVLLQELAELPGDPSPGGALGELLCRWAQDDLAVAIVLIDTVIASNGFPTPDPEALATIYVADIAFDANSGAPSLVSPWTAVAQGEQFGSKDITTLDWSPSGEAIVFGLKPDPGAASLKIAEWTTGVPVTRTLTTDGYAPTWSPDGHRIAFKPFDQGVHLINPDGSGLTRLTRNSGDYPIGWSSDSLHVLFQRSALDNSGGQQGEIRDVLRIPTAGGKEVNLTSDIDGVATPIGWR